LRILVITNLFPDRKQPTFGTFMSSHVAALKRAGADVHVAAIQGAAVHTDIPRKYVRLFLRAMRLVVARLLRGSRFDIVEAHLAYPTGVVAWPLARLTRARLVLYCHGADVNEVGLRSKRHHALASWLFRRADLLVANSQYTKSVLLSRYDVPEARVVVWSPGIDTDIFHPMPDLPRSASRVLFVGRLDSEKGVHVLIDAMHELREQGLALRIVGTGPVREALEVKARDRGIVIEFVGGLAPVDVAREMAQAPVLVVPSVYAEPLGLVALEGMASGSLVVASSTGGLVESVEPGRSGWLVPPGDARALAMAVAEAVALANASHDPRMAEYREAAQRRAAEHDIYRIAAAALVTYAELAGVAVRQDPSGTRGCDAA